MGESRAANGPAAHLDALRRAQNPDGGWGYFPGKQSWLEPTAYAALALHGEPAADHAWSLIKTWQTATGGWRPSAEVQIPHWSTALAVTVAISRGEFGQPFQKGVAWLLDSAGVESKFINIAAARVGLLEADRDLSLKGWPWKPNTSSWVEPTAHSLVALKRAAAQSGGKFSSPELRDRVRVGEAQLLDVRCRDGGWNYGSRAVLGEDLPSYPETTALGLLGLQQHADLSSSIELAKTMAQDRRSRMALAWMRISLALHGVDVSLPLGEPLRDVLVTAVDALGAGPGREFFRTGATA